MTFVSPSSVTLHVDTYISAIEQRIAHQVGINGANQFQRTFRQAFLNTLDTTVERCEDGTTFIITGDIPAMWLRDSSAQVRHYLPLTQTDENMRKLVRGLILRQAQYVCMDPYANAFNRTGNGEGHSDDQTEQHPWVWERKYELDSLCSPVKLLADYIAASGDESVLTTQVHTMLRRIVQTMRIEQHHDTLSTYRFERPADQLYLPSDTLPFDGKGTRTNYTGMVWSGFRPSDDACMFGYLIPANLFATVILGDIARFADHYKDRWLALEATSLREEILFGVETYGIVHHPRYGRMYAYECDGFGNHLLMDDANVPSLLSLPYLGVCSIDDPIYCNTRAFVLSNDNPHYYVGKFARGVGSPHTGDHTIWHIGLIVQALTSNNSVEKEELLAMILATTADTDYMHESFDPDNPHQYTRPWFAWANSLFAELVSQEYSALSSQEHKDRVNGR